MPTDATIRPGTMDDFAAICRLLGELDDHHVGIRPDVFQPFDDSTRQHERVTRFFNQEDAELFVAAVGSNIVGLATVRVLPNPDAPMFRPDSRACMDNLVVNRNFRGLGIAKMLLDRVTEWTQARQLQGLVINVWHQNEAGMSFFTANGFTPRCHQMEVQIDRVRFP